MKISSFNASGRIVCHDAQQANTGLFQSSDKSGYYLLKNGSVSPWTVYDQEWGILIDEQLSLSLKMSKTKLSAQEVLIYCQTLDVKLPSLYQICRYSAALKKINASLEKIGMGDFGKLFADDNTINVFRDIWYQEAADNATNTNNKRYCILIDKLHDFQEPSCEIIDKEYMLYDKSMLYRFDKEHTPEEYVPAPLQLIFSWEGLDFLSLETPEGSYDFYRGKDLKVVYLGRNVKIRVFDKELVNIDNTLWQNQDGKLYKIDSFGAEISYQRDENTGVVELRDSETFVFDGIPEYWTDVYSLHKNDSGRYVQTNYERIYR